MSQPSSPLTLGAHHIGLTIPNLAETKAFFLEILGFSIVAEKPDYPAAFVTDGTTMITLWQAETGASAAKFDRKKNTGLHHLAFKVAAAEVLAALHNTLVGTKGVEIEFAPEPLGGGNTQHLMCTIPGGIRIEFIAPAV